VIERCRPLSPRARRAEWVGCNILVDRIPPDGRLAVVEEGKVVSADEVRERWARMAWLGGLPPERRGWTVDVLRCVRAFAGREFTSSEIYEFEELLAANHPANRHVRDKIRQQLQVLRKRGTVRFLGRGRYVAPE